MDEMNLFIKLKEAYETSTHNNNHFATALHSISWDDEFVADGEHYFTIGGFVFTTPSLNPFEIDKSWKPSALFSDYSEISF